MGNWGAVWDGGNGVERKRRERWDIEGGGREMIKKKQKWWQWFADVDSLFHSVLWWVSNQDNLIHKSPTQATNGTEVRKSHSLTTQKHSIVLCVNRLFLSPYSDLSGLCRQKYEGRKQELKGEVEMSQSLRETNSLCWLNVQRHSRLNGANKLFRPGI